MSSKTILLAGANRGLGLGLAREYLDRGWQVIATARDPQSAQGLRELQSAHQGALAIEQLDVADPASGAALAGRMGGRKLDALFVVAGMSGYKEAPIHEVPPEGVAREFVVNASGPVTLAETLQPFLAPDATVAFMTSVLGSIAGNTSGGWELYRASKAALNMFAASYAVRHRERPVILMHPGWVRTDMGGPDAPVSVEQSAKGMVDVLASHTAPGVAYLDYQGSKLPW